MLLADAALHNLRWNGEGPQECCRPARRGPAGGHTAEAADQLTAGELAFRFGFQATAG